MHANDVQALLAHLQHAAGEGAPEANGVLLASVAVLAALFLWNER